MTTTKAFTGLDKLYLNGKWEDGHGSSLTIHNPYTGDTLFTMKGADANDLDTAYKQAEVAQHKWAKLLYNERMDILQRALCIMNDHKKEFIDWLVKESGSTRTKAKLEYSYAYEALRYSTTYPSRLQSKIVPSITEGKESKLYRKPLGVVGVISPWNFPLHLTVRSVAPAIALGNSVVLKPATNTPVSGGLLFARVMHEAGLPPGVLNVIVGHGNEIGDSFCTHKIPKLISFTGSTKAGKHIGKLCGENLKKVALELGGNGPFMVLDDADINHAVACGISGKFLHSGQICIAVNRFLVQENVYDEFCQKFVKGVEQVKVGDPAQKDVLVGPLITKDQVTKIRDWVQSSIKQGAKVLYEGKIDKPRDNLMAPIVLGNVTPDMDIFKNEIFGPVACIYSVKDDKEMVRLANGTEYGLAASVHTTNLERGMLLAKQIEAGMLHINDTPVYDEPTAAFGGEKASGIGRFGSHVNIEELTTLQWVTVQYKSSAHPQLVGESFE